MKDQSFFAAGRPYLGEHELRSRSLSDRYSVYQDCYGRRVLVRHERFPCFDEFDRLYENRYYHIHYIIEADRVTRVTTSDAPYDAIKVSGPFSRADFMQECRCALRDPALMSLLGL